MPHTRLTERAAAVDPVGVEVDLGDQVGQHGVPDRALRGRSLEGLVVPGLRDTDYLACDLNGEVVRGDQLDGRVPPCGLVSSLSSSIARRLISSSACSSAMCFLALASSAFSAVLRPG